MVSAISNVNSYYGIYQSSRIYGSSTNRVTHPQSVRAIASTWTTGRAADPETPVQPVRPVTSVGSGTTQPVRFGMSVWSEQYAAEQAVRSRIQYPELSPSDTFGNSQKHEAATPSAETILPGWSGTAPTEMAVRMRIQYVDPNSSAGQKADLEQVPGMKDAQETAEEGKCETCEKRKYQDGSDDMSVSYQTPTRIDPDMAASAVRGHEMEHVIHEQSKAQQEDRKVVSQSVTLHTDICPECGKVYVSGGTTRTVTKADTGEAQSEAALQKPIE